tara:strand:+ start:26 stop:406 length:381 start_codon:yes stop_codon:yes gene_type:complete
MINDTVDILDANIINLGINFEIIANINSNKHTVLKNAINALKNFFAVKMDIGENLVISDIFNVLNKVQGVSDTTDVDVKNITLSGYSSVSYNIKRFTSADDRMLFCPENAIFEVKRPSSDFKGAVR